MTTKTLESVQLLLAGNTYLYRLFQNIFGNEPSRAQLDILTSDISKEAFELFWTDDNQKFTKRYIKLGEFEKKYLFEKEKVLELLRSEYTRLFIGPGKLPAPPWESVYRSDERLLFQESTLEIRRFYLEYNIIPAAYPHVADDHLALELDFMACLSEMAEQAFEKEDFYELNKILNDQRDFLINHLLVWVPEFAERIQESSTSYLYPNLAKILKEFLMIQEGVIQEIKENI